MGELVYFKDPNFLLHQSEREQIMGNVQSLKDLMPAGVQCCTCVEKTPMGLKVHMIANRCRFRFESSVTAPSVKSLLSVFTSCFAPEIIRLKRVMQNSKARKEAILAMGENDPIKKDICSQEKCPIYARHSIWPGKS